MRGLTLNKFSAIKEENFVPQTKEVAMATAVECGLITAALSVAIIAVVNGVGNHKKENKVVPANYTLELAPLGLREQVGTVKRNPAGMNWLVFNDNGDEHVALVGCGTPKLIDGKVSIYRTDTHTRVYVAACP